MKYRPIVLIVLDGWGLSPAWGGNALSVAKTPRIDELQRQYPWAILQTFRKIPGIVEQFGNSEIGHATIGSGRLVPQALEYISESIKNKSFFQNSILLKAIDHVQKNNSSLHLLGLVSDGGIHSHINHLFALLELAKNNNINNVFIHFIADGRDTPPNSTIPFIQTVNKKIQELGSNAKIATIIGRNYAMDKVEDWDKTSKTYNCLVKGQGLSFNTPVEAVAFTYKNKQDDNQILPSVILHEKTKKPIATIKDNDAIILFNFRPDRIRQLTLILTRQKKVFPPPPKNLYLCTFASLTDLPIDSAFPLPLVKNNLAQIVSENNLKQLRLAETEKTPHVTYFFNGGKTSPYPLEDRIIVPSPRVSSYVEEPQMAAEKIRQVAIENIKKNKYDFILINFANVDMLSHTGDLFATVAAAECVDKNVGEIVETVLAVHGAVIITADHGNAEQMIKIETGDRETFHSFSPVPFILVTPDNKKTPEARQTTVGDLTSLILKTTYTLADVAPTILELMELPKPAEMTGESLLKKLR